MKKKLTTTLIILAAIVFVIIVISSSITTIKTGEIGLLTTFGQLSERTLPAGFHWKSPFEKVTKMSVKNQKRSLTTQSFSADTQQVDVQISVNYCIDKDSAKKMFSTVGIEYYDVVILPKLTESIKVVFSEYTAERLITDREKVSSEIFNRISGEMEKYSITIISVNLEDIDFTDAFTTAIEKKQVAKEDKLRAETEQATLTLQKEAEAKRLIIEAEAQAQAKIIAAEAEAEANKKVADSITDKILAKMFYEKWNGELPRVMSDAEIILPSEFLK